MTGLNLDSPMLKDAFTMLKASQKEQQSAMEKRDRLEDSYQRKLIDLDRRIVKLEKLEIARQKAEIRLENIEKIYSEFFTQSKDLIVLIQNRMIKYASPSAARLLGYTREKVIDTPFGVYANSDELPRLVKYWSQRIAGKDAPPIYKTILKHKDGHDVHVEIRAGIVTYQGLPADLVIVKRLTEKPQKRLRRVGLEGPRS